MGLVLEEIDEADPHGGVRVKAMTGESAKVSRSGEADLCIGDRIVEIMGEDCRTWTFDEIMDCLVGAPSPVELEFERPAGTVSVKFGSGVAIAASPGEILGNVALEAEFYEIQYDCRSGSCGTCEQKMISITSADDEAGDGSIRKKTERFIRPCVGLIPNKPSHFLVLPSDRFMN